MRIWFKNNYKKLISIILFFLFINIVIYIMYGSKSLLNSDSTFIVDYAKEQIRTNSIFPSNWINTNDFWIYSLIPGINFFLRMGFNQFLSRQISVLIQTLLLLGITINLFKKELRNVAGLKVFLILLLSGISIQFLFELFGDATYQTIIFYMLLELLLFIKYKRTSNNNILLVFGIILTFLTSFSLRFPIYIGAPLICCIIYLIYNEGIKNNKKILFTVIISIAIGYLLNIVLKNNLTIYSNVNEELIDDSIKFGNAIKQTIFDYFWLCGSTGLGIRSLSYHTTLNFIHTSSPLIILVFIKFIYAIFTLYIPFNLYKKFNKLTDTEKYIFIYTVSFSILIIFFLIIGGLYTWYRYMTPVVFFLNILYPIFYKHLKSIKVKQAFIIYIILCTVSSLIINVSSYYDYKNMSFKENKYQDITNFLISKDLDYGYTYYGKEQNLYRFLSEGKVQINTINKEGFPHYWMNSRDWFSKEYHYGKVFFLREKDDRKLEIEDQAIIKYSYSKYRIFVFYDNEDFIKWE